MSRTAKQVWKRGLAVFLSLLLLFSMGGTSVFAEGLETSEEASLEEEPGAQEADALEEEPEEAGEETLLEEPGESLEEEPREEPEGETNTEEPAAALQEEADKQTEPEGTCIEDGVYRLQVNLRHAVLNQSSMGNAALRGSDDYNAKHVNDDPDYQPLLIVEDGKGTLLLETMPMGALKMSGYLLELSSIFEEEEGETVKDSLLLAEHRMTDGSIAYDSYNDPDSEYVMEDARGKAYPSIQALELESLPSTEEDFASSYQWVQVYVPIMESISTGSGKQKARLVPDYASMTRVEDLSGEVEYWLYQAMKTEKGNTSEEAWESLQSLIEETKEKLSNTLESLELVTTDPGTVTSPIVVRHTKEMNQEERKAQAAQLQEAIRRAEEGKTPVSIEDGVYRLQVNLRHAYADQSSMGNMALRGSDDYNAKHVNDDPDYQPMLIVEDGKGTLLLETMAMGFLGTYGYLLELNALYDGGETTAPSETLTEHRMTDGSLSYDAYNDPDSEYALEQAKGKAYPHLHAIELESLPSTEEELSSSYQLVQVFVPVMESIGTGSGTQRARLVPDYANMTKVEDLSGEVEYWLYQAVKTEKGEATESGWENLQAVIRETKEKLSNTLESLELVTTAPGTTAAPIAVRHAKEPDETERKELSENLQRAIRDKDSQGLAALTEALEKASGIQKEEWTQASYEALQEAVKAGETVKADPQATEKQRKEAAEAILEKIENLIPASEEGKWDGKTKTQPEVTGGTAYIRKPEELAWMADYVNKAKTEPAIETVSIEADLDLNGKEWTPIGNSKERSFQAVLEGNGHTITGFSMNYQISSGGTFYLGLLGYAKEAEIRDLTIEGKITVNQSSISFPTIFGGAFIGYGRKTPMENCVSKVDIVLEIPEKNKSNWGYIGSMTGMASGGKATYKKCLNYGNITDEDENGSAYIGGLLGEASNVNLEQCGNEGDLKGRNYVGGLIANLSISGGENYPTMSITQSYNHGDLETNSSYGPIGGIIGMSSCVSSSSELLLTDVYNSGKIITKKKFPYDVAQVGGIIGQNAVGTLTFNNVYSAGEILRNGELSTADSAWVGEIENRKTVSFNHTYALEGSAASLYNVSSLSEDEVEVTLTESGFKEEAWMKSEQALESLGGAYVEDRGNVNGGFPVLAVHTPADYSAVDAAIEKANGLNPENYKDFSGVTEAIEAVVRDKNGDQQKEVDAMAQAIEDAIAALEYKDADYSKVDEAIEKANGLKKENYKDFSKVTAAIEAVVRDKNITQQKEVDAMAQAIEDAIAKLEYKDADYSKVDEAIEKANGLDKENYKDFSKVTAAIEAVVRDKNITQQKAVDAMAQAIEDAIAALEYKDADYSKVDAAIEKANGLDKENYKDFSKVTAAIEAVVRDKNITQQKEVDAMAQAIEDAIAALEYKDADYSKVDAAIEKAESLNPEEYVDFSAVTKAVEAVVRGKNITEQKAVDAMAQAIEDAIAGLEKRDLEGEFQEVMPEVTVKEDGGTVTVSWKEIPYAKSYRVYRKEAGGSFAGLATVTEGTTSYTDKTAKAGVTYYYTVKGFWEENAKGTATKYPSNVQVYVPHTEDSFAQAVPEVSAKAGGDQTITVNWEELKEAKSYRVYRKEAGGSFAGLATVTEGTTSYTDKTAKAGVTYYYTVKGFWEEDAKGTATKYPTDVSVKIPVTSLATPSVSTKSMNYCTVDVSWKKITGAEKYVIYRKEAKAGTSFKSIGTVSAGTFKYRDGNARLGVKYYYTVKAYAGSISSGYVKNVTGTAVPSAPNLKGAAGSSKGVTVSWAGSKKSANSYADGYRIFRKTAGGTWKTVGTVGKNTRSYTDTTGKKGTTYYYTVRAYVKQSNGTNLWGTYDSAGVKGAKK